MKKQIFKGANGYSFLKNFFWVAFSNLINLTIALFIGFLFPKYVSTETYAIYKTYNLYIPYAGLFHMGLINGIYIRYGSYSYNQLPKKELSNLGKFIFIQQILIQFLISMVAICLMGNMFFKSPFFFVSLNTIFINVNTYYSLINQFTLRFKLDSLIQIASNILNLAIILILFLYKIDSANAYLWGCTFINVVITVVRIGSNKKIVLCKEKKVIKIFPLVRQYIKKGFSLMLSEFTGILVISMDCVIINLLFNMKEFAIYSFAVSIITLLMQVVCIGSKVIFPYLARISKDNYGSLYEKLTTIIVIVSAYMMGFVFFASIIIKKYLPNYIESISVFLWLGLAVVFKALIENVCSNFYKVLGETNKYWRYNVFTLFVGFSTDIIAYLIWKDIVAIAIFSVVTYLIWYIMLRSMLIKRIKIKKKRENVLLIFISSIYVISINLKTGVYIYFCVLLIVTMLVFAKKGGKRICCQ